MWFYQLTLRRGSQGPAVADVRRRLYRLGYLPSDGGLHFDEACKAAVIAFQSDRQLRADGIVGPATWSTLYERPAVVRAEGSSTPGSVWAPIHIRSASPPSPPHPSRVEICLSQRTLTLWSQDRGCRTLPVAIGRPLSPTPTGRFYVAQLLHRPGEPLGVGWIRLKPATCSIHGTNEPWTIGSDVTPGCVHLHNKDVEIVFHRVQIGTPVTIAL